MLGSETNFVYHHDNMIIYSEHILKLHESDFFRVVPETQIKLSILKQWLTSCEDDHGSQCAQSKFSSIEIGFDLLLADLLEKKIVKCSTKNRCISFSYVWGGVEQLRLTKETYAELTQQRNR
jgi:hypothetical protein